MSSQIGRWTTFAPIALNLGRDAHRGTEACYHKYECQMSRRAPRWGLIAPSAGGAPETNSPAYRLLARMAQMTREGGLSLS